MKLGNILSLNTKCFFSMTVASLCLASCGSTGPLNGLPSAQLGRSSLILSEKSKRPADIEKIIIAMTGGEDNVNKSLAENIASNPINIDKRNQVQDYLIAVSNEKCGQFKRSALLQQSSTNFGLGSLSTIFATAGALVGPPASAQAFSGASAALQGVKAEYQQNFFREKAFEVITKGINSRRERLLKAMYEERTKNGNNTSVQNYTIHRALADVINYNNACSLIEGLEEVSDAISLQDGAGITRLSETLQGSGIDLQISARPVAADNPTVSFTPENLTVTTSSASGTLIGKTIVENINSSTAITFRLVDDADGRLMIDPQSGDVTLARKMEGSDEGVSEDFRVMAELPNQQFLVTTPNPSLTIRP